MSFSGYRICADGLRGRIREAGNGALQSVLHEHGLIIVEKFPLDLEEFSRFARCLGPPELVAPPQHAYPGYPFVRLQSNVPGLGVAGGGEYWHSDGPWSVVPSSATLLLCRMAPDRGGETLFVDMREAFDALPDRRRTSLLTLKARYPCREIYQRELDQMGIRDPDKLAELQDLTHPLVRTHPQTGRKALYLNEKWLERIEGMAPSDSRDLLDGLLMAATDRTCVYGHRWTIGDLLVWDNISMMHKALPPAQGAVKTTYRITIKG